MTEGLSLFAVSTYWQWSIGGCAGVSVDKLHVDDVVGKGNIVDESWSGNGGVILDVRRYWSGVGANDAGSLW